MRITNLNPDTDIGASAWLVELDGHRLLMDAGTHPKREGRDSLPLYESCQERGSGRHRAFRIAITTTSARCRWR